MKKLLCLFTLIMLSNLLHGQIKNDIPRIASQAPTCSLSGLELEERNQLMEEHIKPLIQKVTTLDMGYSFSMNFDVTTLEQVASFIALEKKCCSFITYNISLPPNQSTIAIEVVGSNTEDKELIRSCWQLK